jgi:hypothetical protein
MISSHLHNLLAFPSFCLIIPCRVPGRINRVCGRFSSADRMHEAVVACLVAKGETRYSAYLSYRAASEAPLARLLFDELNHRSSALVLLSTRTLTTPVIVLVGIFRN